MGEDPRRSRRLIQGRRGRAKFASGFIYGPFEMGEEALEASACEMSPAHDLQHVLFIGDLHRGCLSYLSGANSSGKPTGGITPHWISPANSQRSRA